MWICIHHQDENKEQMAIFKNQWMKKGGRFVLTAVPSPDIAITEDLDRYSVADIVEVTEQQETQPIDVPLQASYDPQSTISVTATGSNFPGVQKGASPSLSEATEVLRKAAGGAVVRAIPAGEPLFMFSVAEGKTRPLHVFYDRGCSHVCFRRGVPEDELESRLITPGPIYVNGVGNTTVEMWAEYVVLLNRSDGSKQAMVGVESQGQVTASFPKISLTEAIKEIKEDDPINLVLQNL